MTPLENLLVRQSAYNQILSLKAVRFMALYILVYVGVEVTIGGKPTYNYKFQCVVLNGVIGWIVTYRKRWTVVIRIRFVWFLWQLVTPKA